MTALFAPLLRQSLKSSGIYLLLIALVLAISATTALKFSNHQIQQAVALQAAEMLAADLVLTDQDPIESQWQQYAQQQQLQQSQVTMFSSMAHTTDQFVMVNVKAIDAKFPLRGKLQLKPTTSQLQAGQVWLSPRAMDLLQVQVGDTIHIADAQFQVSAQIEYDSNQEIGFSGFSPTVIISAQDVAKTNAIQVGSRIEYRLLLSGTAQQTQAFSQHFNQQKNQNSELSSIRLRQASEGNSRLMRPIENLDTFLQLANILTILLCGIAIALTSQRYVQQNQDHIALLRCLGATRQHIFLSYLLLLSGIGAVAMVLGSLVGLTLGYGLLQLMLQLIPHLQLQFSAMDLLLGPLPIAFFTSMVVLLGFVVPHIWQLLNTPPIRVIRQQAQSSSCMVWTWLLGTSSLIFFSIMLTENIMLSGLVIGAILLLCVLLYSMVWLFLKLLQRLKTRASAYVRQPQQTALQITALALGLSLVTVLAVLRTDMLERWQQQLPEKTPNQFVYGLPPFDLPALQQHLQTQGWSGTPLYPNIRGRLIAKNDQAFSAELLKQHNSLRRELNLTQSATYPVDNQILAGREQLQQVGEVSVEAKTANELGIKIGDHLTFSLPDGEIKAKVVNLRSVEWESFSPNFFFIFAPKTMDENAGSYLGSFYVPEHERAQLVKLIQQFSNTVFIDVSLILQEIKRLVTILMQIVTILALLVSVSGILVLIACLNLLMDERKREVALMRAFGASKQKLKWMLSIEIGFIGLIAGIVACIFAEIISAIACYRMDLSIQPHWEIWLLLPLSMMIICTLIGRYRLSYLCDIPPLQSLREL